MADDSDDDKTEEPTEKKLTDAIERGNTPVSRELTFLTSLIAYLLIQIYMLPSATPELARQISHFLDDPSGWRLNTGGDATLLIRAVAAILVKFLGPPIFLLMAFGVGGTVLQ